MIELANLEIGVIELEDRFRKDFGDMEGLVTSIKTKGLIQPLAVARLESGRYRLLAGGRRLIACKQLGWETVPVRIYPEAGEYLARAIELAENIDRASMGWAEEVELRDRVHQLYIQEFGEKISKSEKDKGWSQQDTAKALGKSEGTISRDLALAAAIKVLPELKNIKNKTDAVRALQVLEKRALREDALERTREVDSKKPPDELKQHLINSYRVGDFLKEAQNLPSQFASVIEVDPPYAIDLDNIKKGHEFSEALTNYHEIEPEEYVQFLMKVYRACFRLLKDDGWLIAWFGPDPWFSTVADCLSACNFSLSRIPAIWEKHNGQTNSPNFYLANSYEMFFYARKSQSARIQKPGRTNVFDYDPIYPNTKTKHGLDAKYHPTQKPIALMMDVLYTFAKPGDNILVPFLGSGATLLAACNLSMTGVGFDLSEEYKKSFELRVRHGEFRNYEDK